MKEALFTKSLTVAMSPDVYEKIKKFTDEEKFAWQSGSGRLLRQL